MKKRIIIAIGLTVALSMTGCASKEITQTKAETTVELGSECSIIPTDYFELGSKVNPETIAVDTSAVDTNTVGEYVAVVTYNDNTYEIKVSVSDTIVPEIVVKPDIEGVDRGTTIHPADYVEVNDLSEVEVYFVAEDGDVSSLEIPSDLDDSVTEINYTVVAVDASGNRSEELIVTVPINEIVLEIDAAGVDGTTEEGEYDETNNKTESTESSSKEKIKLEPNSDGEITLTDEEAEKLAEQILQDLVNKSNPTPSHIEGNPPPAGCTPSTGEVPQESNFDPSDTTGIEGVTLE